MSKYFVSIKADLEGEVEVKASNYSGEKEVSDDFERGEPVEGYGFVKEVFNIDKEDGVFVVNGLFRKSELIRVDDVYSEEEARRKGAKIAKKEFPQGENFSGETININITNCEMVDQIA